MKPRYFILAVLIATPIYAADWERILFPILKAETPGAFGSRWRTELCTSAVGGDVRVAIPRSTQVGIIAANTKACRIATNPPHWLSGEVMTIDSATVDNYVANLRIWDVSRESDSYGTEIPIVREREFKRDRLHLLNVPLDDRFRVALRIYDPERTHATSFRIVITDMDTGQLFVDEIRTAQRGDNFGFGMGHFASSVELGWLTAEFPQLPATGRVMIAITTPMENVKFWALVTVTNNKTQQVTTITPQ